MEFLPVKNFPFERMLGTYEFAAVYVKKLDRIYIFGVNDYPSLTNWYINLTPPAQAQTSPRLDCSNIPTETTRIQSSKLLFSSAAIRRGPDSHILCSSIRP
jgi:hypothetical protein